MSLKIKRFVFAFVATSVFSIENVIAEMSEPTCEESAKIATVAQVNTTYTEKRKLIDDKEVNDVQQVYQEGKTLKYEDLKKLRRIMIDADKARAALGKQSQASHKPIYDSAYQYCITHHPTTVEDSIAGATTDPENSWYGPLGGPVAPKEEEDPLSKAAGL